MAQGTLLKERINPPHLASSPTRHSYLNSGLLKSEPIVNLSTAQLIGYEVLTQLPSKHDSEVFFFQQLMLMEGIETSEQRSIAFLRWCNDGTRLFMASHITRYILEQWKKQDAQRTTQGKTPPFKKCQRLRLPLSLSNAADI